MALAVRSMLRLGGGSLLLCAMLSLMAAPASAQTSLSPWVTNGILTFYGGAPDGMEPSNPSYGTKEGACGYGAVPKDKYPYFSVAALSLSNQFSVAGPLKGCGQCFQIQCTDEREGVCVKDSSGSPKSIIVMISDVCPECGTDHVDVQALSFAKIAQPSFGRIKMQYRRVECTPPDYLKVAVLNYRGAGGWVRLSIGDTGGRGAVRSVDVRTSGTEAWQALTNSWGAQWETYSAPAPPLDFRMTTDNGETVIASGVVKTSGIETPLDAAQKFATNTQFPISGQAAAGSDMVVGSGGGSQAVASFSGPPDSSGPAPTAETSFSAGSCSDVPPPGPYTCQQQKDWGKCSDDYYKTNQYCAVTCGFCGGSTPSGQGQQRVASYAGPADSGRRLLRERR